MRGKLLKSLLSMFFTLLLLCGCKRISNQKKNSIDFFEDCTNYVDSISYYTKSHDLFQIQLPKHWDVDNELKQGVDISTKKFNGNEYRGLMLTVLPYRDYYYKRNNQIEYFDFQSGVFKGRESVFYRRNDLRSNELNESVLWRGEIKIYDEGQDNIYWFIFTKRSMGNVEPEWCEFNKIVNSLEILD